ncbi:MAG TPA: hypothetical protein PK569_18575, partial [Thermoanaerobaculia bacterium]|nr:hypothetical protein [Thermoanaerobaculia bacterium]
VNRGGPKEIVRHGHDGLLSEADPVAFASAMARLAGENGLHERLAMNAPSSAARFGWAPFVSELDDELERTLGALDAAGAREAA